MKNIEKDLDKEMNSACFQKAIIQMENQDTKLQKQLEGQMSSNAFQKAIMQMEDQDAELQKHLETEINAEAFQKAIMQMEEQDAEIQNHLDRQMNSEEFEKALAKIENEEVALENYLNNPLNLKAFENTLEIMAYEVSELQKKSIKSESPKINVIENYYIKEELKHIAKEKYIENHANSKAFIESQIIDAEYNAELEKHLSDQSESEAFLNHKSSKF